MGARGGLLRAMYFAFPPQRVMDFREAGGTPESPASGMTQQQEKRLSEGWMDLAQPPMIPCAKPVAGTTECSQTPSGPQGGIEIMGLPRAQLFSPGVSPGLPQVVTSDTLQIG